MADVGRLAGVSATAVSFVINGRADGAIGPETQQRIHDAVRQLGYRPNRAAQSLRTRRTRTIAFVTDEIAVRAPGGQSISGVDDVARKHDSLVLIVNATRDTRTLPRAIDDLIDRQVDAIVFAAIGTRRTTLPPPVHQVPTVLVNCFVAGNTLPSILPDETNGGQAAAQLVLAAGHRQLAFITGQPGAWATRERLKGARAAVRAAGVGADDCCVLAGNFRVDSGYELTRELLARRTRPTAILCGNDLMALGAYLALKEEGVRIPEDVSIVGYDDQADLAAFLHPALSTVRLPYYEMGRLAAEHIFGATVDELPPRSYVQCPVVARASIAAPPTN